MKAAGSLPKAKEKKKKLNKKQKKKNNADQIQKCHLQTATEKKGWGL